MISEIWFMDWFGAMALFALFLVFLGIFFRVYLPPFPRKERQLKRERAIDAALILIDEHESRVRELDQRTCDHHSIVPHDKVTSWSCRNHIGIVTESTTVPVLTCLSCGATVAEFKTTAEQETAYANHLLERHGKGE